MLNILVCVKQVPDINLVKMDPVTGSLIRAGVPAILNPLDANALEAAVRVKEAHGGSITVITMGPDMAKEALRECLAAGADRAVLLSDRAFANADTLATSYVIVIPIWRTVSVFRNRALGGRCCLRAACVNLARALSSAPAKR